MSSCIPERPAPRRPTALPLAGGDFAECEAVFDAPVLAAEDGRGHHAAIGWQAMAMCLQRDG
jgi:hypothetical protein